MILILSPYLFLRIVLFRYEFVHEFVDEFFANFVHEFKYEIRTNSNSCEFFCTKNWLCYEWPVLKMSHFPEILKISHFPEIFIKFLLI